MAKKDSVQKRLEKVRPPRVQLTYDVEIGDAIEQKEIPFVTGVLADFTGKTDPDKPLPKLKDRKFVNVDLDNFDDVMQGMAPKASYRVKPTKLSPEGGEFAVNLEFDKSMDDFRPEAGGASRSSRCASCSKPGPSSPTCATSWPATRSWKTSSPTCCPAPRS